MRIRTRYRLLELAGAFLLALFLMFSSNPPSASALEDENWKNALQQLQEAFQGVRMDLKDYAAGLNREVKDFRKGLARLEKKKGQMLLWFGSSYDPEDLNDLLKGLFRLRLEAEDLLKPFADMERKLEIFEPKLDEMEAEISRQLVETPAQEYAESLSSSLDEITDLKVEVGKVKAHMGRVRTLYGDFIARMEATERTVGGKVSSYWRIFYLQPLPSIFSSDTWSPLRKSMDQWLAALGIVKESLGGKREWLKTRDALLQGLAMAGLLMLLGWAVARKVAILTGTTGLPARLLPAWSLLSLSASALWVDRSIPFTLYGLSSALNEVLLSSGLVCLYSLLRSSGRNLPVGPLRQNPLWPFWVVLASGLLLDALGLPYAVAIVLWPLVLLLMAWRLYRLAPGAEGKLERIWTLWSPYVLCGLALLAVVGFAPLSVIITIALFYFLLAFAISVEGWRLLRIWETRAEESGQSLYAVGCLSGIGFPCMILGLLLLSLWLLSLRLGGESVFLEILSFQVNWQDFSLTLKGLSFMVVGFYLTKTAIFLSETFLSGLPHRRPDLDKVVIESLSTLIRYACWAFFGLTILFLLGMDLTNLAVIAGGLSVGIGFGLQHIVNNFFSGLILLIGRSIQSGDTIQLGSMLGDVRKVTIRHTVVQTRENATLFVPNSDLITNQLINWSHRDRRVVREVLVGVAYGSDTAKVTALLLEAAGNHPYVLSSPPPVVYFCQILAQARWTSKCASGSRTSTGICATSPTSAMKSTVCSGKTRSRSPTLKATSTCGRHPPWKNSGHP